MIDLVILVPDKNAHYAVQGALRRPISLGIRPITWTFRVHPGRDGGVRKIGPEMLAMEQGRSSHTLLLVDFEGCGTETLTGLELEHSLDERLRVHWGDRAKAVVVEPEIDIWMWGSDSVVAEVLQWTLDRGAREWLASRGWRFNERGKPERPKEALQHLVREIGRARSSSLYQEITSRIGLRRCEDPSFVRLREQLQAWFSGSE